jgi:hypothetical protein
MEPPHPHTRTPITGTPIVQGRVVRVVIPGPAASPPPRGLLQCIQLETLEWGLAIGLPASPAGTSDVRKVRTTGLGIDIRVARFRVVTILRC